MKRDMQLIYKILRYAEERANGRRLDAPSCTDYSPEQVHYHIGLCEQAGYLEVALAGANPGGPPYYVIVALTWSGHEVLAQQKI